MSESHCLRLTLLLFVVIAVTPIRASAEDYPSFQLRGFADLEVHSQSDNRREGLDVLELDLYPRVQIADRWSALAEMVALHDWRNHGGEDEVFDEINLERLYLTFEATDTMRIEAGETHTGILQWNEREHRSRMLQTTIDVPALARSPENGGAWPLRFVGIWLTDQLPGPLGFKYGVGFGNGPGRDRDSIAAFDRSGAPAEILSFSIEPEKLHGFQFATTAYAQRIPTADPMRERDLTFSLNYVWLGAELRSEWARMEHTESRSGRRFTSTGYYVLASHRLRGRAAAFRPYLLLDTLNLARGEDYLRESAGEDAWAAGLRWDVSPHVTVKSEYRSQRGRADDREGVLGVQLGLSF